MRTGWVIGATVLLAIGAAPVAAAPPLDPIGLSADHTADCSGITIVTEGWPEGSAGVLTINGVGYTIPMGGGSPLIGTWSTEGTYDYVIRFTVPGQVPGAEGATITCPGGAPSPITPKSEPVVEAQALTLPATL